MTIAICRRFSRFRIGCPGHWPSDGPGCRSAPPCPSAPRTVVSASRVGSSRIASGSGRARGSCDRAAADRSRPRRATRTGAAATTCSTVRPSRPAATGSTSHVASGVPAPHAHDVHHAAHLLEPAARSRPRGRRARPGRRRRSSPRSGSAAPRGRRSCPGGAGRTRSRCPAPPLRASARRSLMISSAERWRSPRGFSRTRMSPVFCCVANRPSSEPVRREKVAISGVSADDRLHLAQPRSVSSSALPGGRQVVDDEAAFVRCGQEAACPRAGTAAPRRRPGQRRRSRSRRGRAIGLRRARSRVARSSPSAMVVLRARRVAVRPSAREQRDQRQRQHQRDEHGDRERERQRAEELADDARQQAERREHHDGRQRGADDRRDQFRGGGLDRARRPRPRPGADGCSPPPPPRRR